MIFSRSLTEEESVNAVNRYVQLNKQNEICKFCLQICLGEYVDVQRPELKVYTDKWFEFAVHRSVKELNLAFYPKPYLEEEELKLPGFLFSYDSPMTHFTLGYFDFSPPAGFTGFGSLVSLYLRWVNIADDTLESIVLNCPVLSDLYLWECSLSSIKILSPKDFQLKRLLVAFVCAPKIDIMAPNLKSFHFSGFNLPSRCSFQNIHML
ncbi:hypothetical protein Sjap_025526 [Stephania japonica]|uniref:At1g61320/AtMIF1 LRR domain-containing protein n=1 Tax=Stephania japonica TaxID=461633 RepID=A0AAP0E4G3_9MAGN